MSVAGADVPEPDAPALELELLLLQATATSAMPDSIASTIRAFLRLRIISDRPFVLRRAGLSRGRPSPGGAEPLQGTPPRNPRAEDPLEERHEPEQGHRDQREQQDRGEDARRLQVGRGRLD